MVGEVDSDLPKNEVHRPLHFRSGVAHLGLDAFQKREEVEPFWTLHDPLGSEAPAGAGSHGIVSGHPPLAKSLLVRVLLDDIRDEPVRHFHKGDGPHEPI